MCINLSAAASYRRRFFIFAATIISLSFATSSPVPATSFIDDVGRSVEIGERPLRIVSLAPSITEILFAIGLSDEIVGVTEYSNYPLEAVSKEKVGSYVKLNIEKIVSLKPDLVIATAGGNPRKFVERLAKMGPPVFVIHPGKIKDIYANIRTIGAITGKEKEGNLLAERLQKRIDGIVEKVGGLPRPKVFFQLGANPLYTSGGGTFVDDLIKLAGGINIAGNEMVRYPVYSIEEIIKRGPDIIFSVLMGTQVDISVAPFWSRWPTVPAVQNGRIYAIDPDIVNRPSPRIVDGLEAVARKLHPEAFEKTVTAKDRER